MATFPIEKAPQELRISPATAARANIDTRTGPSVGAAIGQALVAGAEIYKRRQQMQDANLSVEAEANRRLASEKFEAYKLTNSQDTWVAEWERQSAEVAEQNGKLKFSSNALAKEQIRAKMYSETGSAVALTDATRQLRQETKIIQTDALIEALSSDDPQKKLDQIETYKQSRKAMGVSEGVIAIEVKAAQADGEKLRKQNAVDSLTNAAVLSPDGMVAAVTKELNDRKANAGSEEFALLTNSDLESLRDYSGTIGEQQKTQSEINRNAATVDAYSQIRDGATDLDKIIDDNNADPLQSNEDKIVFAEKIPTYFKKINSAVAAEASDADIYDMLTQSSEKVERGAMSPVAFEELYANNKSELTVADQRAIREKDIVATRTMQNRSFTDAMIVERPTFVAATQDEISAIKLARKNAELINDIPSLNMFNIALEHNRAQQWNYGRYREQLRSQINQNPEWSTEQIAVAQDILVEQLDVSDDALLREFDKQNPSRAITNTPPDAQFKSIWKNLSFEDKSLIWSERMAGVPVEVLLESDNVQEAK